MCDPQNTGIPLPAPVPLELKQKPLHPHWQCILFHTFSVQPYKSWIFSSQAVPDITLQVPGVDGGMLPYDTHKPVITVT